LVGIVPGLRSTQPDTLPNMAKRKIRIVDFKEGGFITVALLNSMEMTLMLSNDCDSRVNSLAKWI
jgi:hypothetical protein